MGVPPRSGASGGNANGPNNGQGDDGPKSQEPLMDDATMKRLFAMSKTKPVNCAIGTSKDGKTALLLLNRRKKPRDLARDLQKAVRDAKNLRWGTAIQNLESTQRGIIFTINKPLNEIDRMLRKTLRDTGYRQVDVTDPRDAADDAD